MFLDFYRLREQPFGVTPDPRFLYFSPGHREALASLFYGIETGRGFLSLVAEPGMGKTTLLFQLLKRWKGYVHSAFLFQTQCDSRELLRYLMDDLGLDSQDRDIVKMHSDLNDFLFREAKAGKRVVLFIDEAQNLSDAVLETVRLLSDFEAPDRKLLQIVLAGQPDLEKRLTRPGLTQLGQRIAVRARLDSLPPAEVIRYIHHRLQTAGYPGPELFTPEASAIIAERSRGIPRMINHLCFNALSLGCAMRSRQIGSEIVREAAADLSASTGSQPPGPKSKTSNPQTTSGVTTERLPSFDTVNSWIKARLFQKRAFQTSLLVLLLLGLAVYLGSRVGVGTFQRPSLAGPTPSNPSTSADLKMTPEPQATNVASGLERSDSSGADGRHESTSSFTYIVQPNDTLRQLCLSVVGRYDEAIQTEIRTLNPNLKDLTHLNAGQEIRLPLNSVRQGQGQR